MGRWIPLSLGRHRTKAQRRLGFRTTQQLLRPSPTRFSHGQRRLPLRLRSHSRIACGRRVGQSAWHLPNRRRPNSKGRRAGHELLPRIVPRSQEHRGVDLVWRGRRGLGIAVSGDDPLRWPPALGLRRQLRHPRNRPPLPLRIGLLEHPPNRTHEHSDRRATRTAAHGHRVAGQFHTLSGRYLRHQQLLRSRPESALCRIGIGPGVDRQHLDHRTRASDLAPSGP